MITVHFIDAEKQKRSVQGNIGDTLMEAAVENDVPGIEADCGGSCACATCHVMLEPDWFAKIGAAQDIEQDMLAVVSEVDSTSRLSCQLVLTEDMDGLVVRTPKSQY